MILIVLIKRITCITAQLLTSRMYFYFLVDTNYILALSLSKILWKQIEYRRNIVSGRLMNGKKFLTAFFSYTISHGMMENE